MDFAELEVKRNNLASAWKTVGREVVEVVAADIEQLRFGGKATWDFGVSSALTGGMLSFNLRRQIINFYAYGRKYETFEPVNCQIPHVANGEYRVVLNGRHDLSDKPTLQK